MAIFSLRLTPVGKSTQKRPFTAAAHVRYISRKDAATHIMAMRMPDSPWGARRWLIDQEAKDRKNARVVDKMIIALPRELTLAQQAQLIHGFAEALTKGRASWFAAIHANGKDRNNPHCHLIIRDRDVQNGQRVVMFSAGKKEFSQRAAKGLELPTTLQQIRELWATWANHALRFAGRSETIDHRSHAARNIKRPAQVHEGPNIRAMHQRGYRPESKSRTFRNRPYRKKGTPPTRIVHYADIDKGQTRAEFNDLVRDWDDLTLTERHRVHARLGRATPQRLLDRRDRSRR